MRRLVLEQHLAVAREAGEEGQRRGADPARVPPDRALDDLEGREALAVERGDLGVEAVAEFARSGKRPEPTPGLDFVNTGVELVTNRPAEGLPSINAEEELRRCWG